MVVACMRVQAAVIQSPLSWEQLKSQKFASTTLWVLVGFFELPLNKSSLFSG